ncbi:hypothetical protein DL89DRAFT_256281 [Linderina pennispora]|uniref:Uncharacterized protein n=1 Tax=Linderina pennispora TaxID=61395 RepID=A0A1Y1WCH6_9FUNG|nr:uncharacterized protein DL89DRAFT_256281 [Linderina pennispora]ORX71240.1 hypothetical protein DL89DRAFT_256281 [Linderina pennispora]
MPDDAYGHQTQPAYSIHTEQPADNSPSDSEPNERVSSILDDIMTAHRPPESMDSIDYSYIYMRLRSIRDLTERARLEAEQRRQQEQDQQAAVTDQPPTARRSRAEHANIAGGQAAGELPRHLRRRATLERESAQSPTQQLSFSTFSA